MGKSGWFPVKIFPSTNPWNEDGGNHGIYGETYMRSMRVFFSLEIGDKNRLIRANSIQYCSCFYFLAPLSFCWMLVKMTTIKILFYTIFSACTHIIYGVFAEFWGLKHLGVGTFMFM